MDEPIKVFCSYRGEDRHIVQPFVERLRRDAGIDAWLDVWEIGGGDDVVARMDDAITACDASLIFVSKSWFDGAWAQDERTSVILRRVEDGIRVVPVVVDDVDPTSLPPSLRKLSRRRIENYDGIVDALRGVDRHPPIGIGGSARHVRVEITVSELDTPTAAGDAASLSVSAVVDGERTAATMVLRPSPAEVGRALAAASGPNAVEGIGRRIGQVLLPPPIGDRLQEVLNDRTGGSWIDTIFVLPRSLHDLPVELAHLPDGDALALRPWVSISRRIDGLCTPTPSPRAGPLKILCAIGAPDEGKTTASPLDHERELGRVLDAVEPAETDDRAQVKILEVGHPDAIRRAMATDSYQILHLSGHGDGSGIELEDEDGNPVPITAAQLNQALADTHHWPPPLIVLSACAVAGASDAEAFAVTLIEAGVPNVVAMQAPVSDQYATALTAEFYRLLSEADSPSVARALAAARRTTAQDRDIAGPAQWPVSALLAGGEGAPLVDNRLDQEPLRRAPVRKGLTGQVPMLGMDDLVGRRSDLRRLSSALRHPTKRGVVLRGIGGVGKSSLAGRAMSRLAEDGHCTCSVEGPISVAAIAETLRIALGHDRHPRGWARDASARLDEASSTTEQARLRTVGELLRDHPILLVLDNFEDNQRFGHGSIEWSPTAEQVGWASMSVPALTIVEELLYSADKGRVLFTSRLPLVEVDDLVVDLEIGALSPNHTRQLFRRLDGLGKLAPEEARLVHRLIGGHPRVLEFVNAALSGGVSTRQVTRKLRDLARRCDVDLTAERSVVEAIAAAVQIGARDIALDELIELLDATDRELLCQIAVSSLPTPVDEIDQILAADTATTAIGLERLATMTLIEDLESGIWTHRWTAEGLATLDGDRWRRCAGRAGDHRRDRFERSHDLNDLEEAARNLAVAERFDDAVALGDEISGALADRQLLRVANLALDLADALPPHHAAIARFQDLQARALAASGATDRALDLYGQMLARDQKRVAAEPGRADYQRDLSVSYNRLGDIEAALGHGDVAQSHFRQGLDIAERLAAAEPGRDDYQRDLSVSYERLGSAAAAAGQTDEACRWFGRGIVITERLVAAEPERADLRRELAIKHLQIAAVSEAVTGARYLETGYTLLTDLEDEGRLDHLGSQVLQQLRAAGGGTPES